jgi:hypothetical protein
LPVIDGTSLRAHSYDVPALALLFILFSIGDEYAGPPSRSVRFMLYIIGGFQARRNKPTSCETAIYTHSKRHDSCPRWGGGAEGKTDFCITHGGGRRHQQADAHALDDVAPPLGRGFGSAISSWFVLMAALKTTRALPLNKSTRARPLAFGHP